MTDSDRAEVAEFIEHHWHNRLVMSRGRKFYPHEEDAIIERRDGQIVGLVTFHIDGDAMEMLTLNATLEGAGIGTALILSVIDTAREEECGRISLTTTNDNLRAIGFYQRLGFRLTAVNVGAVDEARKTKPQIPDVGERGIPIHDEIVMDLSVKPSLAD